MRSYALLPILLLIILSGCKQDQSAKRSNDLNDISKYITEHSLQRISVRDEVMLRFRPPYDAIENLNERAKISPKVAGQFSWEQDGLLIFRPDQPFGYDSEYVVSIDVPNEPKPVQWRFSTMPLRMEMSADGINIDAAGDVYITGIVRTSDYVGSEKIEQGLKAIQSGNKNIAVEWDHDRGGRQHRYRISGIAQDADEDRQIELSFNGGSLDDFSYNRTFTVFPQSSFQFISAQLSDAPERRVRLQFSSPVAAGQNLKGLVTIDQQTRSTKTHIEGNVIYVYPPASVDGEFKLYISDKLKSTKGKSLGKEHLVDLRFDMADPAIRSLGRGTIVPDASSAIFAIETMNLKAVDVEVVKIFNDNVLQHLQNSTISDGYNLEAVGRIVWRGKVDIDGAASHTNKWMRVGVNLRDYLSKDLGAIYQIRVGYQRAYAYTDCDSEVDANIAEIDDPSMMEYRDDFYYHYEHRDDACSPYYYNPDRFVRRNVLLSDVGVITKRGRDGSYTFAVSDLPTGQPLSGARVVLYDYQQQPIVESITSADGLLTTKADRKAAFAVVSHAEGYGYVRYRDNESNSLSEFDVAGIDKSTPIDGFIYMDRGVYRPGDTIYMHFMLEDVDNPLPGLHPVTLTVKDPKGAVQYDQTTSSHVDRIYSWAVPTSVAGNTGGWRAAVKVGQKTFYKNIRVEAIKPNRLKISLSHPNPLQYTNVSTIDLNAQWLYGAPAKGLEASVEATLLSHSTTFEGYDRYTFVDPAREGVSGLQNWYNGPLSDRGSVRVPIKLEPTAFPGKIKANIKTRVFEPSGNFSVDYGSMEISPFDSYVGVATPQNRWGYSSVELGEDAKFEMVVVNPDGTPMSNRDLSIGFYDVKWSWWYYRSNNRNLYRLNSAEHKEATHTFTARTDNQGRAVITTNLEGGEHGRKMIRVCDKSSGHCTGAFFYASRYGAPEQEDNRESLAQLTLSSDKEAYAVGEKAKIYIPTEKGSRLLVSIEDGTHVIHQEWIDGQEQQTDYEIPLSAEMAPNVYAHVTMIQAYDTKNNDLPIRMYGVLPISVENPAAKLLPKIQVAESIRPEESFDVRVSEENGRVMSYTIAVVDEGLLDLTRYRTPSPFDHFYAHQSLGVNTWDIYKDVLTGVNGEVDQMISIGGDGANADVDGSKKATRFKPVVMTAGPFKLAKGQKAKHTFTMPNYMGSVRTMVVARYDDSYGHTDTKSAVKAPVMVLATLPRVLSPGEEISIPVSVFATESSIRNVDVSLELNDHLELIGSKTQTVAFDEVGDHLIHFKAKVREQVGIAQVQVKATSGRHKATQEIELDVRNPNPYTSTSEMKILRAGESYEYVVAPHGTSGTNQSIVELSTFPSVDLENRLNTLTTYPHGCLEQTASAALPQLYLTDIMELSKKDRDKTSRNISHAIRRISRMQLANGGFAYWPGGTAANDWGTSYAGHFLIEAKANGYAVRGDVISKWTSYQAKQARAFKTGKEKNRYQRERAAIRQAYRLYTLAMAGAPELSAMNVMKLNTELPNLASYLLAGSYAVSGKKNTAIEVISGTSTDIDEYVELGNTYGSTLRDKALIAQVLMKTDRRKEAAIIMKDIAQSLNSNTWYSTQTLGQSLAAVGGYLRDFAAADIDATIAVGTETPQSISTSKPLYNYSYNPDDQDGKSARITNNSSGDLYVSVINRGQKETAEILNAVGTNRNISLSVRYTDMNGKEIDVSSLSRGTDFIAECSIRNLKTRGPILSEMALTQVLPAGWEIQSGGLSNVSEAIKESRHEYRDVRDDRVSTFFDLRDQSVYRIQLTAAYDGEYYLPPVVCQAMYDESVSATTGGQLIRVTEP